MKINLTVLGTRGSVSVEGKNFSRYGGATSCYQVLAGKEEIYLDAGSGICSAKSAKDTHVTILLSHMHLDHVVGLPFFSTLVKAGRLIDIYSDKHEGLLPEETIDRLISPPFWPCKINDYPANVKIHLQPKQFSIGDVAVDTMYSNHPNESTIYRLTYQGKSLVYATDFEHTTKDCEALAAFSKGCDLLLYDAQYTPEEYEHYKGYGHSTTEEGLKVADKAGVKRILFVHHAPWRTDDELINMEREIANRHSNVSFAKIGDRFSL